MSESTIIDELATHKYIPDHIIDGKACFLIPDNQNHHHRAIVSHKNKYYWVEIQDVHFARKYMYMLNNMDCVIMILNNHNIQSGDILIKNASG